MSTDPSTPMPMRPLPPSPNEDRLAWRTIFARRVTVAVLSISIVLLNALVAWAVVEIRTNQQDGRAVLNRINDCTEPDGECFQRGQRQTATVVGDINRVTIYAATCGAEYPGQVGAVERCVRELLATDERNQERRDRRDRR